MPAFFPSVYGNRKTCRHFGEACLNGTLSHAYILEGPQGSGKTTLARQVAAALACEEKQTSEVLPCGHCDRCRRILTGNAPDVKVISAAGATLGVDQIREMRSDMYLSSSEGGYKVYLIDDAHKMTPQAQNALLKVLEEPPTDLVVFLLTERAEALLATIRSRTQLIRMELFSPEEMETYLEKNVAARRLKEKDPEAFRALLEHSGGCFGQVLDLLDGKRAEAWWKRHRAASDAVKQMVTSCPYSSLIGIQNSLPGKRQELGEELELYLSALRDLILVYHGDKCSLTFYASRAEAVALAEAAGLDRLLKIYDLVVRATDALSANANVQLTLLTLFSDVESLK